MSHFLLFVWEHFFTVKFVCPGVFTSMVLKREATISSVLDFISISSSLVGFGPRVHSLLGCSMVSLSVGFRVTWLSLNIMRKCLLSLPQSRDRPKM